MRGYFAEGGWHPASSFATEPSGSGQVWRWPGLGQGWCSPIVRGDEQEECWAFAARRWSQLRALLQMRAGGESGGGMKASYGTDGGRVFGFIVRQRMLFGARYRRSSLQSTMPPISTRSALIIAPPKYCGAQRECQTSPQQHRQGLVSRSAGSNNPRYRSDRRRKCCDELMPKETRSEPASQFRY